MWYWHIMYNISCDCTQVVRFAVMEKPVIIHEHSKNITTSVWEAMQVQERKQFQCGVERRAYKMNVLRDTARMITDLETGFSGRLGEIYMRKEQYVPVLLIAQEGIGRED